MRHWLLLSHCVTHFGICESVFHVYGWVNEWVSQGVTHRLYTINWNKTLTLTQSLSLSSISGRASVSSSSWVSHVSVSESVSYIWVSESVCYSQTHSHETLTLIQSLSLSLKSVYEWDTFRISQCLITLVSMSETLFSEKLLYIFVYLHNTSVMRHWLTLKVYRHC